MSGSGNSTNHEIDGWGCPPPGTAGHCTKGGTEAVEMDDPPPNVPHASDGVDAIQAGHYTGSSYVAPNRCSVVIADGAQVLSARDQYCMPFEGLLRHIKEDASGPCAPPNKEKTDKNLNLGWYWVDSTEATVQPAFAKANVHEHFKVITYKDNADGHQSSEVDCKIQSLIAWALRKARVNAAKGEEEQLDVVLIGGDGDHAPHLWKGVTDFVCCKQRNRQGYRKGLSDEVRHEMRDVKVRVFVIGHDSATVSQKLKRFVPPPDIHQSVEQECWKRIQVRCKYFRKVLLEGSDEDERYLHLRRSSDPRLCGFVDMVFKRYDRCERLVNNRGLHALVTAAWGEDAATAYAPGVSGPSIFIVDGETGSGKSTQIPQILYDMLSFKQHTNKSEQRSSRPRVLCTQPRRVACETLAQHVEGQRKTRRFPWSIDNEVGYHISGRKRCNANTPIVYCTAGVLLQQLTHNVSEAWNVIVLDEVHERSIDYELLLAYLLRPDMLTPGKALVIMSATLETLSTMLREYILRAVKKCEEGRPWLADERFVQCFDITTCQQYGKLHTPVDPTYFANYQDESGGRVFDVELFYLDDLQDGNLYPDISVTRSVMEPPRDRGDVVVWKERLTFAKNFVYLLAKHAVEDKQPEVVLVFLPALAIIREFEIMLTQNFQHLPEAQRPPVSILHGQLGHEKQQEALQSTAPVRVILSTNVGESSITIEDATTVVDLCLKKQVFSSAETERRLDYAFTSKDSCDQRKGRVGRCGPGKCYRLITRAQWETVPPMREADITCCRLDSAVLNVLNKFEHQSVLKDPLQLLMTCMTKPEQSELDTTVKVLELEYAALTRTEDGCKLLPLGRMLHVLSVDIDLAVFVMWASVTDHALGNLAADYAGVSSLTLDVVTEPCDTKVYHSGTAIFAAHRERAVHLHRWCHVEGRYFPSDVVMMINLLSAFRASMLGGKTAASEWCKKRHVNFKGMCEAEEKAAEVRRQMHRYRPLFSELPAEAVTDVVDGSKATVVLRREHTRLTLATAPLLLFVHAAVNCRSVITAVRTPRQRHDVSYVIRGPANKCERKIRSALQHLRPHLSVARVKDLEVGLTFPHDDGPYPHTIMHAAQFEKCWRPILLDQEINRVNVVVPEYGFELSHPGTANDNVTLRPTSSISPLLLPASFGPTCYVYPTGSERHQSKFNPNLYTRVCSEVTALSTWSDSGCDAINVPAMVHAIFGAQSGEIEDLADDANDRMDDIPELAALAAEVKRLYRGGEAVNDHFIFDSVGDAEGVLDADVAQRAELIAPYTAKPLDVLRSLIALSLGTDPDKIHEYLSVQIKQ